ncbi:MAG: DUF1156 domain-containing protein, partial [Polyangiaceae bacterium]|nr:DUF1156 domain-containing protein [Polyangiaceae bacterium]
MRIGVDRRLIEDVMPIEAISAIAAKEKSYGKHPVSLVHYWPARRPPTACRAAIYAALVAAPQSDGERSAAARFLEQLAAFDVDADVLDCARESILSNNDGIEPKVLDMFSGGGAISLEATRLGCDSYALDYNPVAHIIELCTLRYPQKFGAKLAEEVERAGASVVERLRADIGDLYPEIQAQSNQGSGSRDVWGSTEAHGSVQVMAYIWARTVPCCKPGCRAIVPLVRQSWLRKKPGDLIVARPKLSSDERGIEWEIARGTDPCQFASPLHEQTGAGEAVCLLCSTPLTTTYVKERAIEGMMKDSLAAVVTAASRSREYHAPCVLRGGLDDAALSDRLVKAIGGSNTAYPGELLQGKLRDQLPG